MICPDSTPVGFHKCGLSLTCLQNGLRLDCEGLFCPHQHHAQRKLPHANCQPMSLPYDATELQAPLQDFLIPLPYQTYRIVSCIQHCTRQSAFQQSCPYLESLFCSSTLPILWTAF